MALSTILLSVRLKSIFSNLPSIGKKMEKKPLRPSMNFNATARAPLVKDTLLNVVFLDASMTSPPICRISVVQPCISTNSATVIPSAYQAWAMQNVALGRSYLPFKRSRTIQSQNKRIACRPLIIQKLPIQALPHIRLSAPLKARTTTKKPRDFHGEKKRKT